MAGLQGRGLRGAPALGHQQRGLLPGQGDDVRVSAERLRRGARTLSLGVHPHRWRRVSEGQLETVPAVSGAHPDRGAEGRVRASELHGAPHGEVAPRARPEDHRLGRDSRRRRFAHGDRHVVARLEGRHCGGQGRQPRHHGAQCPLLPGLLPDQDPDEGADGHRRLCPDAQGLRTGPLRPAYARGACLHPRRAGQPVDRVYRHVPAPEAHAAAASGRHRRGGLVLRPQGFRRLQTPHELPAQVLRCRRAELRHLFLRRQGRIAVRSVKTSP